MFFFFFFSNHRPPTDDKQSNRHSFNDGYHTAHHLNPRRHWREHPTHLLQQKPVYAAQGALVFRDIDYIFLTVMLLRKDYLRLADRLVPISEAQRRMGREEVAAMLRTKTRAFSEAEVARKFQ